ncbi:MAG: molecular chaperone Tir [Aquificae bacterium]|nr:molecular chaperone Tir [Aquificota bacterium]
MANFEDIKRMVVDIGLEIKEEVPEEEILVVEDEERGIKNMILDCEGELLVIEQPIGRVKEKYLRWFMERNRELPFGAFALDGESGTVLYRQTLKLDTLDYEELEASIASLEVFMAEWGEELVKILKEGE